MGSSKRAVKIFSEITRIVDGHSEYDHQQIITLAFR